MLFLNNGFLLAGVAFDPKTGALNKERDDIVSGGWFNEDAQRILAETNSGIPVLGGLSSNMSIAFAGQHHGTHTTGWTDLDCLHFCQGGRFDSSLTHL